MELSRRDFLKASGASLGGAMLFNIMDAQSARAIPEIPLKKVLKETTTICCYCSVGCGAIVSTFEDGKIKIEGDPDHPISRGSLCSKGAAMAQVHEVDSKTNPWRLTKPLYRAPNSTTWEEKPWEWMLSTIARRVKDTRDRNWNAAASRTDALAGFGGGELDNEECYILSKMSRALGITYLEHCARI